MVLKVSLLMRRHMAVGGGWTSDIKYIVRHRESLETQFRIQPSGVCGVLYQRHECNLVVSCVQQSLKLDPGVSLDLPFFT